MDVDWTSIIVAAFTGLTVVSVLLAGFAPWVAKRPKVILLDLTDAGWYCIYRTGDDQISQRIGSELSLHIVLKNDGLERSYVNLTFTNKEPELFFRSNNVIPIDPAQRVELDIRLYLPAREGLPEKETGLKGELVVEPSGNKRMLWGRKWLKRALEVPYDEAKSVSMVVG